MARVLHVIRDFATWLPGFLNDACRRDWQPASPVAVGAANRIAIVMPGVQGKHLVKTEKANAGPVDRLPAGVCVSSAVLIDCKGGATAICDEQRLIER
jgi:hypothetical protein